MKNKKIYIAALLAITSIQTSIAAVSVDEASKLNTDLTPLGAERNANSDGSIPEWTGGFSEKVTGASVGDIPVEIFSSETPLYQVNAKNSAEYAELLTDGTKALLAKYPDTFNLQVFPTHRTASAPKGVYKSTYDNALNCKTTHQGNSIEGCIGGIPFPIPKTGAEVMWNYVLRVEAPSIEYTFKNIVGNSDGSHTLATRNDISFQYPPYYDGATVEGWDGEYSMFRFDTLEPSYKQGESLVIRDSIKPDAYRKAWQYLLGQRRVRRAPTVAYDTPDFVASGANYFDEVQAFFGALDRFSWKLVGKKEMLIPYNTNGFIGTKIEDAIDKFHLSSEHVRWEKHRVWVVEATVAEGKRHAVPKRTYYIDEDSWLISLVDGYDTKGKLWRTTQVTPFLVPSIPAMLMKTATVFNLQAKTMSVMQALNGENFKVVETKPDTFFTGDAVAADAVR